MTEELNLADLPSVPLSERGTLPNHPAIYFAMSQSGDVLYIGRAVSLCKRWSSHQRLLQLEEMGGVRIAWLAVLNGNVLPGLEGVLIDRFKPSLNRAPVVYGDSVIRCLTLTPSLHEWTATKAREGSFRNAQDFIVHCLRRAREKDLARSQAA